MSRGDALCSPVVVVTEAGTHKGRWPSRHLGICPDSHSILDFPVQAADLIRLDLIQRIPRHIRDPQPAASLKPLMECVLPAPSKKR